MPIHKRMAKNEWRSVMVTDDLSEEPVLRPLHANMAFHSHAFDGGLEADPLALSSAHCQPAYTPDSLIKDSRRE